MPLLGNAPFVKEKNLTVEGMDINAQSVRIAQENIKRFGLEDKVCANCCDLFKYETNKKYSTVLFSECWAVIPCIK